MPSNVDIEAAPNTAAIADGRFDQPVSTLRQEGIHVQEKKYVSTGEPRAHVHLLRATFRTAHEASTRSCSCKECSILTAAVHDDNFDSAFSRWTQTFQDSRQLICLVEYRKNDRQLHKTVRIHA